MLGLKQRDALRVLKERSWRILQSVEQGPAFAFPEMPGARVQLTDMPGFGILRERVPAKHLHQADRISSSSSGAAAGRAGSDEQTKDNIKRDALKSCG